MSKYSSQSHHPLSEQTINKSLALLDLAEQVTHQIATMRRLFVSDPTQLDNPQVQFLYQRLNTALSSLQLQLKGCNLWAVPADMTNTPVLLRDPQDDIGQKLNEIKPSFHVPNLLLVDSLHSPTLNPNIINDNTMTIDNSESMNDMGSNQRQYEQYEQPQTHIDILSPTQLIDAIPQITQQYIDQTYYQPNHYEERQYIKGVIATALALPPQHTHVPLELQTTHTHNTIKSAVALQDTLQEPDLYDAVKQTVNNKQHQQQFQNNGNDNSDSADITLLHSPLRRIEIGLELDSQSHYGGGLSMYTTAAIRDRAAVVKHEMSETDSFNEKTSAKKLVTSLAEKNGLNQIGR